MSIHIDAVLAKKFETEAQQKFQDSGKLRNTVRIRPCGNASQVQFHVIGSGVTQERTAIQTPLPLADITHTPVVATVKNYTITEMTDIFKDGQISYSEREELVESLGMAMGRRVDQAIIDALDAHSFTKTVAKNVSGSNDNLNVAGFVKAAELLGSDVPDNDRNLLCHDSGYYHFLQESDVKDFDINFKKPLADGQLPSYMGFDLHKIGTRAEGGLALATNDRTNYAWQKSAIGLAINMEPKITIDWVPTHGAWMVSGYLSLGAVVIQDAGVVKLTTDES